MKCSPLLKRALCLLFAIVFVLAGWQISAMLLKTPALPTPAATVPVLIKYAADMWPDFLVSLWRLVVSLLVGTVVAAPIGLGLGRSKRWNDLFAPVLYNLYPLPKIVLLPILLVLFGLGDAPKIALIALTVNRGTFYLHYHDIYELLESVEQRLLAGMTNCVEAVMKALAQESKATAGGIVSKAAKLKGLGQVIAYYERNKRYITVLLGTKAGVRDGYNPGDPSFISRRKDELKPLWLRYVIGDQVTDDYSDAQVDLLLECTLSGTLFMVGRWLEEPAGVSAAEMGHLVYDLAIRDAADRLRA